MDGLYMWLRADQGITLNGSSVAAWDDITANNNDWEQTTAAEQPLFVADAMNGEPVVRFDGVDNGLTAGDILTGLTEAEVFVVLKIDTDPPGNEAQSGLWVMSGAQATHYPYTDGVIYESFGTDTRKTVGDPTPLLTSPRIYNISTAANAWTARLDGAELHTTGTNTVGWTANPVIGPSAGGTYFLDGDIAEVLLYDAVLSAGDRTLVHAYLGARYGISV